MLTHAQDWMRTAAGLRRAAVLLASLAAVSCGGSGTIYCTDVNDPEFAGEWATADTTLEMTVAHYASGCGGSITALGDMAAPIEAWGRIAVSAKLVEVGRARGKATLFSGDQEITRLDTELLRNGNLLSFDLAYSIGGTARNEHYELYRQP